MRVLFRPQLTFRPSLILPPTHHHCLPFKHSHPNRTLVTPSFPNLTNLTSEPQSLQASRTLSYPSRSLYSIITDVDSYSHFLPYCTSSKVRTWSSPDPAQHQRWPYLATIQVGWGGYSETITSKIYCSPSSNTVEAIAGSAQKSMSDSELPHYADIDGAATTNNNNKDETTAAEDTSLFKYLYTRWTIRPFPYKPPAKDEGNPLYGQAKAKPIEKSDVSLKLEFCFANPIYAAMSKAVAPKVAQLMVEAFERRAGELLGKEMEGEGQPKGREVERKEKRGSLDGVVGGGGWEQTP